MPSLSAAVKIGLLLSFLQTCSLVACAEDFWESGREKGKQLMDRLTSDRQEKPARALPGDLPVHWRKSFIRDPEFDADIFVADVGSAKKPAILLVHGLGQNGCKDWLKVVPALEANYRVLLLDLPGFGYSDKPAKKFSPTAYAQLLHRLKQQFSPHDSIKVVGHSMGAAVSLRYADVYPGDINQLILADAAGILQRTAFVKQSAEGQVDADLNSLPNALLGYAANLQDFGGAFIEKLLKMPDPTSVLSRSDKAWGYALVKTPNINAALALAEEDFSRAVYSLKINTSIIWGEKDPVAPMRTAAVLARAFTQDRINIIAGAGHVPMISHPQEFNFILNNLLDAPNTAQIKAPDEAVPLVEKIECTGDAGKTIKGNFRTISVKNCKALLIADSTAQNIIIEDSLVTLENVKVQALKGSALNVRDSVVVGTNITLAGESAVDGNHFRLDFAGATIQAEKFLIRGYGKSRVILSVSQAVLSGQHQYLHGDFYLQNQRLDDLVGNNAGR